MAAVAQEHAEQLKFAVGQQGFAALRVDQAPPVGVQGPVGKLLERVIGGAGRLAGLGMAHPAHQVLGP
ncbi:hypothetical protein D3C80_2093590 [compost metagenome]